MSKELSLLKEKRERLYSALSRMYSCKGCTLQQRDSKKQEIKISEEMIKDLESKL